MTQCANIQQCSFWFCRDRNLCDVHLSSVNAHERKTLLGAKIERPPLEIKKRTLTRKAKRDLGLTKAKPNNFTKGDSPIYQQYLKQNQCCFYCKQNTLYKNITRDHYTPKSKGGGSVKNMVLACAFCNSLKASYDVYDFIFYAKALLENTKVFSTSDKLKNIIKTCERILNNEIPIEFVEY